MTASTSYSTLTTVTSVDTKPTGHDTAATTSGQSVATQTGGPEGTASTGQAMHPEEADDGRQGERRHDDGYSAKAVGLGFGLGLLVGAILALSFLACLHCFHKRKSQDNSANAEGGHETEQAASRRFYTPTFMRFGNKQQGMVTDKQSSQQAPSTSFQERHRPKTSPSIPNPFARHDRTSRSLSSSNASDISRGAAHNPHASHPVSSSCSSSFSSPSSSSKASHIAASGPSPTPSAPQPIPPRSSSLKKTDSAASPAGRAAQHMGHSVLFRPRDAALSIDSYDATTWTRSVGRRSGDDDLQGRWRAYDGRGLGAPTDETTWSEIVRQSAKDQH
ncbi:hypothetical protein KEM52_003477 [Ascosphaera acerosa]|nr:hypothetical protein KEM52_003477 [Ascosphaera acerosa]